MYSFFYSYGIGLLTLFNLGQYICSILLAKYSWLTGIVGGGTGGPSQGSEESNLNQHSGQSVVPGKELGVSDSQRLVAVLCSDIGVYSVVSNSNKYLLARTN